MTKQIQISVVVPVFDEVDNVAALHEEIKAVCETENYDYEIIMVDDGSSDGTVKVLKSLQPVTVIELRRNFGQTAALDAGIKQSSKELIVMMDGDRQNDPADIPKLLEELQSKNLDIVSGWRKNRKDPFSKRFISKGAFALRKLFINDGIHDSGCTLKIYRRSCFKNVTLYGEMHRFIPALLKIKGYSIGEVIVNHRPRVAGETKYTFRRMIKGLIDMIGVWFWNKFAARPLHLLGGIGLFFGLIGTCMGTISVALWLAGEEMSDTALPLMTFFFISTAVQLVLFGLIGDMTSKSYYEKKGISHYEIKSVEHHSKDLPTSPLQKIK